MFSLIIVLWASGQTHDEWKYKKLWNLLIFLIDFLSTRNKKFFFLFQFFPEDYLETFFSSSPHFNLKMKILRDVSNLISSLCTFHLHSSHYFPFFLLCFIAKAQRSSVPFFHKLLCKLYEFFAFEWHKKSDGDLSIHLLLPHQLLRLID